MIQREVESDRRERGVDPTPNLVSRHSKVLAAERNIVADSSEDHLRVWVLQQEPDTAANDVRGLIVYEKLTVSLTVVVTAENPGERVQEGRLACSRCSKEQHSFPGRDYEIDAAERPVGSPGVTPSPCARVNSRANRIDRHRVPAQASTVACRPEANRLSAPVAARPRTRNHDPSPAISAPETMAELM